MSELCSAAESWAGAPAPSSRRGRKRRALRPVLASNSTRGFHELSMERQTNMNASRWRILGLGGTWRSERGPANEPQPPAGAQCPKWLAAEAKREWKRLAPWLESQGLLTQGDQAAFAGYCSAWARWVRFERLVQREKAADVAIGQGYVNAATKALHQLTQLLARFGLSPSDRNSVAAVPPHRPGRQTKLGSFLAGAMAGGADA